MASRQLSEHARETLRQWLFDPEHFDYPYPTDEEKTYLSEVTDMPKKQINTWFTNARKRLWAPERQKRGLRAYHIADANVAKRLNESISVYAKLAGQPVPVPGSALVGQKRRRSGTADSDPAAAASRRTRGAGDQDSAEEHGDAVDLPQLRAHLQCARTALEQMHVHMLSIANLLSRAHASQEAPAASPGWRALLHDVSHAADTMLAGNEVLSSCAAVIQALPVSEAPPAGDLKAGGGPPLTTIKMQHGMLPQPAYLLHSSTPSVGAPRPAAGPSSHTWGGVPQAPSNCSLVSAWSHTRSPESQQSGAPLGSSRGASVPGTYSSGNAEPQQAPTNLPMLQQASAAAAAARGQHMPMPMPGMVPGTVSVSTEMPWNGAAMQHPMMAHSPVHFMIPYGAYSNHALPFMTSSFDSVPGMGYGVPPSGSAPPPTKKLTP